MALRFELCEHFEPITFESIRPITTVLLKIFSIAIENLFFVNKYARTGWIKSN